MAKKETFQGEEYLFMIYVFVISGVSLQSDNKFIRHLWNLYRCLIVVHFIMIQLQFVMILQRFENFESVFKGLNTSLGSMLIHVRSFITWKYQNVYCKVRHMEKLSTNDSETQQIRVQAKSSINRMLNLFTANVAFQTIVAIMTSPDYEPLKIPFDMSYLNPLVRSKLERIYESLLLVYSHLESVNFLTIYIPMVELTCELKVISKAFSTIFRVNLRTKNQKHSGSSLKT